MESRPAIAVLGGGIIGMSAAWRLAQGGAAVTVFEAGRIGNQASWAAAGMLAPGGEFDQKTVLADLALHSLSLYPTFIEELTAASGAVIDHRNCGAFDLAFSEIDSESLRSRASRQSAMGIYSEQFPPSRIPGVRPGAIAVQYYPFDSVVNPRDIMQALSIACTRAGVKLCESEPITAIPLGSRFDHLVVAAGAWSSQISSHLGFAETPLPSSIPVRGHLVAFEEHTGLCDAIVRHNHTYLLRRAKHLVIAGSSIEQAGFDRTIDGSIAADIAARAGAIIPRLAHLSYTAWNGLRPGTSTGLPVIGRLGDSSVWLAYGHYRNGILLAPATAQAIVQGILGGREDAMPASSQTGWSLPVAQPL